MINTNEFDRSALRLFNRLGVWASISPDITAAANDFNTIDSGEFRLIFTRHIGMSYADQSRLQLSEPSNTVSLLQSDFVSKPSRSHSITIDGDQYGLANSPFFDDGIEWKYIIEN